MQMKDVGIHANLSNNSKRLEWCDIYKGIIILLVVIGHFTNQYQGYIYQFHMAAFFFISGYTTNFRKYTTIEIVVKKFWSLMLPYYFFSIIGTFLFYILSKLEILSYVSGTRFPDSTREAFRVIFVNGASYCDWLGALWFVPVLFGASIISKMLINIFNKKACIIFCSVIIFLIGQYMSQRGGNTRPIDLICIAQYYVTLGYAIRESSIVSDKEKTAKNYIVVVALVVANICFWVFGSKYTVDWPSRRFNGLIDLLNPFWGIIICVCLAMLLEKIKYVKSVFIALGTYTFAIMVFHFLGFKLSYVLLILSGKVELNVLSALTPTDIVRNNIWWELAVALSIIVSIVMWKILMHFKTFRICSGNDTYYVRVFLDGSIVRGVRKLYKSVLELLIELVSAVLRQVPKLKKYIVHIIVIVLILIAVNIYSYCGEVTINFPYNGGEIYFDEGWFKQAPDEEYRWVEMSSRTKVILINQNNVYIHGYIPDNVENVSQMQIFFNDIEVYSESVTANYLIEVGLDVAAYKRIGVNQLEIVFDGCRIPKENDVDIRKFSALIDAIQIN